MHSCVIIYSYKAYINLQNINSRSRKILFQIELSPCEEWQLVSIEVRVIMNVAYVMHVNAAGMHLE